MGYSVVTFNCMQTDETVRLVIRLLGKRERRGGSGSSVPFKWRLIYLTRDWLL